MTRIFNSIRIFFTAPAFEGDPERTQSARLLFQIFTVIWLLPLLLVVIIVLDPSGRASVIPPAIVIPLVLLLLMSVTRMGQVGFVNFVFVGFALMIFSYADYGNAGNVQPSTLMTAIAIIISGLLLGRRAPVVAAGIIAIAHATIVYLQLQGYIVVTSAPALGFENMIITAIMIMMIGFLLQFVIARLQNALNDARRNQAELQGKNVELQELSKSLEARVAERTRDLEDAQGILAKRAIELQSVAEIATQASQAVDAQAMLQTVVDLTKRSFNLYHAHVYLLDAATRNLILSAGAGEVGRQMVAERRSIPYDHPRSLVARAARGGQGAITNDVSQEPDFLPHRLLPATRSELAVPILLGREQLGVLDIQSDRAGDFSNEDLAIMTTLARQLAVSLQNIRNLARAQHQADRESLLNAIGQKLQNAASVDAVLQIAAREIGQALKSKNTRLTVKEAGAPAAEGGILRS
jgi:putative methionine-R-sulfoxide reductase with GAF domain